MFYSTSGGLPVRTGRIVRPGGEACLPGAGLFIFARDVWSA